MNLYLNGNMIYHDYDCDIPRQEITLIAFLLSPLSDLAPNVFHPELLRNYSKLWEQVGFSDQKMWQVEL